MFPPDYCYICLLPIHWILPIIAFQLYLLYCRIRNSNFNNFTVIPTTYYLDLDYLPK
jgi:hypothetical protein